jgi:hypothetical protein
MVETVKQQIAGEDLLNHAVEKETSGMIMEKTKDEEKDRHSQHGDDSK